MEEGAPASSTLPEIGSAQREVAAMFLDAERSGLKLAIIGRTVALVVLGVFIAASRSSDPARVLGYLEVLGVFAALGLVHYVVIGTRLDRSWLKYVFITLDIAIVSALIATQPLYDSAPELPRVMTFRAPVFPFYFVILGVAAFSFSPRLVLWTGVVGAIAWMAAFLYAANGLDGSLNWTHIPLDPNVDDIERILLDPNFGGLGSRIQEAVLLIVVALLVAIVMARARSTLRRQLAAERDRATLDGIFGRFVPRAIVDAMVAGRGVLLPVQREATVLFADVAGFTSMTERAGAARTVEVMNAYFDEVTRIIGEHNGIVTQFIGDGVLATFNVPIEDAGHPRNAFDAACAILSSVAVRDFAGERLRVRIGVTTGPVFAGNVGGGGRQSYTVYGNTVNLAARLEALCKEYGTWMLVSDSTAQALPGVGLVPAGSAAVRGFTRPVAVFSLAASNAPENALPRTSVR